MILRIVFLFSAFSVAVANNFGPPCLPTRVNYKLHYPCLESAEDNEYEDRMSTLRGEPSAFARTGFYDRLFRVGNTRARQGTYLYEPTYGYNPNLPQNGPYVYRYSNVSSQNRQSGRFLGSNESLCYVK